MIKASIFEAKTNLSQLVKQAQKGEVVLITSGRSRTPVARLETVGFILSEKFFEPLPEEELRFWDGNGE